MGETRITKTQDTNIGCLVLGGMGLIGILLSQCSTKKPISDASLQPTALDAVPTETATAPAPPPPITKLAQSDLKAGKVAYAKAEAVDDATSAQVYSRNCYVALADAFAWPKLDRCGTFDALAAQKVLAEMLTGTTAELEYFGAEAAAGRYLESVIAHGASAGDADNRWDEITAFARRMLAAEKAALEAAVLDDADADWASSDDLSVQASKGAGQSGD